MRATRSLLTVAAIIVGGSLSAHISAPRAQVRGDAAEAVEVARILSELKVQTVADIGAGFGTYTALVAKQLPGTVNVIATDLPARMSVLADGIKSMGASNVKAVQGALTDTNLPDGSCDAIIVRLTYHHFSQPAEMAASLFRTLRPDGTLLMIEMPLVRMPNGDPDGIMPAVLLEQLQEAGFLHQRTVDPFNLAFASPLYLMVLRKP